MGLVIDTSALVSLERAGTDWRETLADLGSESIAVPAIVYGELLVGISLAGNRKRAVERRTRIDALVAVTGVVEFDAAIAEQWAELFATLSRRGRLIPSNAIAIAATARHLDFGVLVGPNDERHYREIPGLRIARIGE